MKILLKILIASIVLAAVLAMPVAAYAQSPLEPHYFHGTVTINGQPAPAGTTVEARVDGVLNGPFNPVTTTQAGIYYSTDPLASAPRLLVQGTITEGAIVEFYINGVKANETAAWHAFQDEQLDLTVNIPLSIATAALTSGTAGVAYSQTLTAVGGIPSYTWSITAGALPAGLNLNASTGVISGTPTTAGTSNFTVRLTDSLAATATKSLSITVNPAGTLSVTTLTLPAGTVSTAYSQTLSATGGTAPYTWEIAAGSLPAGLTLNTATGGISGTPTTAQTYSFTVQVSDNLAATANQSLSITINPPPPLSITTSTLNDGTAGIAYSQALSGTGGIASYTWSITAGALPAGLNLNTSTGVISGTPTTVGTSNFTVRLTDSLAATATKSLSITVNPAGTLAVATINLPSGTAGLAYSQTLAAAGGTAPYTWAITAGSLPAGLSLAGSSGVISGTPTTEGIANFTVRVTDNTSATATQGLSILINPSGTLTVTTAALPDGMVTVAYSQTLTASGGTGPYTWAITSGTLPVGYSFNSSTGTISGTTNNLGTASFTVRVTDSLAATATKSLSIRVVPIPVLNITTTSLSSGTVNAAYSRALTATGGVAPYTWAITTGALPAGLTLDGATGIISGTPTTIQSASFTVQVTDSRSTTDTQNLSITIRPVPSGGGGGGGSTGTTVTTPGLTGTVPIVNRSGILQNNVTLTTPDGLAVINISAGTRMIIDAGNSPIVTSIAAAPTANPPAPPPSDIIVLAYTFEPSRAQFTPPLTLTMSYDPAKLPKGVEPGDLVIAYWDGTEWVDLDSNINPATNTITAKVEHFTEFAILGEIMGPGPTTSAPSPASSPAVSTVPSAADSPSSTAVPPATQPAGTTGAVPATQPWNWVLITGLIAGILVISIAIIVTLRRRSTR